MIPFRSCFKGFSVITYTYVTCLKVAILCVFALCDLIAFMAHWSIAYSERCQTSTMELLAKTVTSKEITSLLRRLKGFSIRLCWMWGKLLCQFFIYIAVATKSFSGKQKCVKFWETLIKNDKYKQKIWKILVENHFCGKVADSQPAIFCKPAKWTPFQISFS